MTPKSRALIKDVAGLFVKYSLADWSPLIKELETGGRSELAEAIRELAATPRKSPRPKPKLTRRPAKGVAKKPATQAAIRFSDERAEFLTPFLRALKARVVAPTAHDLRELYLSIGIKEPYPKRRDEAAEAIVMRLDKLTHAQFRKTLEEVVGQDDEDQADANDYARWFELIVKQTR